MRPGIQLVKKYMDMHVPDINVATISRSPKMEKSDFVTCKTMAKLEVGNQTILCLIASKINNIVNKCLYTNRFLPITHLPLPAVISGNYFLTLACANTLSPIILSSGPKYLHGLPPPMPCIAQGCWAIPVALLPVPLPPHQHQMKQQKDPGIYHCILAKTSTTAASTTTTITAAGP